MTVNSDSDKLRVLHRYPKEKQIHQEHSARFSHDMQLQIDSIEWVLEKIEVNKIPNDRLDSLIRRTIKDLEIRKDKAMRRPDTDDLWTKIETLRWVLYIIFAIPSHSPAGGTTIDQLDPAPTSQQPPVQQQTAPQNTQGVTNIRDINLLSSSSYVDSIGTLHVVGELQNTSPEPREFVEIVATLRDPSGNILDSSFTYSDVEVLRPGEKSPFDVIFSNEQQVQKTQRYEISSITSDITQEKPANLKLNVGDTFYAINSAHVVGEVTNNGPGVSKFTEVSGTFYDDQNKTVATGFTYTYPSDLAPGQSAPFDMIISDDTSANIASGSLNVQSSEYAMILPAVVFNVNGQSDGDSQGDFGSLDGGQFLFGTFLELNE